MSIGDIPLVHLRGNKASDPYLLIKIDGVTVNEISLGTTNTYTRYLSLHAIKQVEIIRGPGAALYGSNAFLGVVNLITDKEKQNIQIGKGSQ